MKSCQRIDFTASTIGLSDFSRKARVWRGWGWNPDEAPPAVEWEVEEGVLTTLSLAQALDRAAEFNRWEDLAR
jgi:hypothetical protein